MMIEHGGSVGELDGLQGDNGHAWVPCRAFSSEYSNMLRSLQISCLVSSSLPMIQIYRRDPNDKDKRLRRQSRSTWRWPVWSGTWLCNNMTCTHSLKACGIDGKTACLDSGWGRSTVDILPLQRVGIAAVVAVTVGGLSTVDIGLGFRTEVSGIDVSLFAVAGTKSGLDKLLVNSKDRLELFDGDVVQEQALAKLSVGDGESLLAVSSLPATYQRRTCTSFLRLFRLT